MGMVEKVMAKAKVSNQLVMAKAKVSNQLVMGLSRSRPSPVKKFSKLTSRSVPHNK